MNCDELNVNSVEHDPKDRKYIYIFDNKYIKATSKWVFATISWLTDWLDIYKLITFFLNSHVVIVDSFIDRW